MYAIIETGSKQYKVKEGDIIRVEKLDVNEGENYSFGHVLAVVDGETVNIGKPFVENAKVNAVVMAQGKEKKVIVYKFKSKKGFHKKKGHRQPFTSLKIQSINK